MTKQEVHLLITQGENQHLDFKRSMDKKHAKTIVSFANASGGKLLIGIEDDGTVYGHELTNHVRSEIETLARQCDPPVSISIEAVDMAEGRFVSVIDVPRSTQKPHRCTHGYLMRNGASSEKMTTEELVVMMNAEGRLLFDALSMKKQYWKDAFDEGIVKRFRSYLGSTSSHLSDEEVLKTVGAISEEGYPTNAGVLFFGLEPDRVLPQSIVHCVAYDTIDKASIRDHQDLKSGIFSTLDDTLIFLKKHLNHARIVKGVEAIDSLEIPEIALREAVVNALIHRDYNIIGAHIMIEVFSDRVEISSPGSLPKGLSISDFGKRSMVRNRVMADIMLRTPYMEKLGTGISRINREIEAVGGFAPEYSLENFVTVIFSRVSDPLNNSLAVPLRSIEAIDNQIVTLVNTMINFGNDPLTDPIKQRYVDILKLLVVKGVNNRSTIANDLGVPANTIKRDLTILKRQEIITFQGPKRSGGYVFTQKAKTILGSV